ncbi:hypothetical protein ACVR1G_08110 [Streptococcus dentasini]
MAFESKKNKIAQALSDPITVRDTKKRKPGRPSGKTRKPWTFTLKPQNRDKLDLIAAKEGFNGASTFLDDWIEKYDLDN